MYRMQCLAERNGVHAFYYEQQQMDLMIGQDS